MESSIHLASSAKSLSAPSVAGAPTSTQIDVASSCSDGVAGEVPAEQQVRDDADESEADEEEGSDMDNDDEGDETDDDGSDDADSDDEEEEEEDASESLGESADLDDEDEEDGDEDDDEDDEDEDSEEEEDEADDEEEQDGDTADEGESVTDTASARTGDVVEEEEEEDDGAAAAAACLADITLVDTPGHAAPVPSGAVGGPASLPLVPALPPPLPTSAAEPMGQPIPAAPASSRAAAAAAAAAAATSVAVPAVAAAPAPISPITHVYIFHDGENCAFRRDQDYNVVMLRNALQHLALGGPLGAGAPLPFIRWNFILGSRSGQGSLEYSPNDRVKNALVTAGVHIIDAGTKAGTVDVVLKENVRLHIEEHAGDTPEVRARSCILLLSSDRDFASDVRALRRAGVRVGVVCRNLDVADGYVQEASFRGSWDALLKAATLSSGKPAPAPGKRLVAKPAAGSRVRVPAPGAATSSTAVKSRKSTLSVDDQAFAKAVKGVLKAQPDHRMLLTALAAVVPPPPASCAAVAGPGKYGQYVAQAVRGISVAAGKDGNQYAQLVARPAAQGADGAVAGKGRLRDRAAPGSSKGADAGRVKSSTGGKGASRRAAPADGDGVPVKRSGDRKAPKSGHHDGGSKPKKTSTGTKEARPRAQPREDGERPKHKKPAAAAAAGGGGGHGTAPRRLADQA